MTNNQPNPNMRFNAIYRFISFLVKSAGAASVLAVAIPIASAQIAQPNPDLNITFSKISQTPKIFPEKQGRVNLVVTNEGTSPYRGPLNVNIYASPDAVLDKNPLDTPKKITQIIPNAFGYTSTDPLQGTDELLGTLGIQNVNLRPGQSRTITVNFASSQFRNPSVVAPGAYYLIAELNPNTNNSKQANQFISSGDPVIVWNATLLNAVVASAKVLRDENGTIIQRQKGTSPPILTRNLAIVHSAIYDAVNSIDQGFQEFALGVSIDPSDPRITGGASPEAAADEAAYTALVSLFPNQKATFDEQLSRSLAQIPDGTAKDNGVAIGKEVASRILDLRSRDGAAEAVLIPYTGGSNPGEWQPSFPDFTNAVLPGWGTVAPFSPNVPSRQAGEDPLPRLQQFGLFGPPNFNSKEFVDQENFVRQIGGLKNTSVTTITRTADQTESALFWSLDRPDTFKPSGQWNVVTEQLALQKRNTLDENALLFAQLNIGQADVGIIAWDAKYAYKQLRPIQAIRQDNPLFQSDAVRDPDWQPLLVYFQPEEYPNLPLTPAFPDYVSGHAVFSGAAGQVLINFFGNDTPFNAVSQDTPGVARFYNTIIEAVEDNAASRIYGGVHIPSSAITQVLVPGAEFSTSGISNNPQASLKMNMANDPDILFGRQMATLMMDKLGSPRKQR